MNNNHALTATNLLASLPQVLRDDESMTALANSVAAVLEKRKDEIRTIAIYTRIDELPEDLMDILAKDFKVDWWDKDYSLETKREILKTSWHTHRILGTKAAVTTALRALYDQFEMKEWWEYGGEPGYFKVETQSFRFVDELDKFLASLSTVKRLSAHLEKITIISNPSQKIYVGFAVREVSHITIECNIPPGFDGTFLTDEANNLLIDERGDFIVI